VERPEGPKGVLEHQAAAASNHGVSEKTLNAGESEK
jgi:DNA-binding XRE family transcriptional regulator